MKYLYISVFFLILSQNLLPQDSAWYYVPVPFTNYIVDITSGNDSDLFVSAKNGLFVTRDNCKSWEQLSKADSVCPMLFDLVITKNHYIIGRIYDKKLFQTTNLGVTWNTINSDYQFFNLLKDTSGNLWGRALEGIYKSLDYGYTWQRQNINETYYYQICISNNNEIYVLAGSNIYLSTDNGLTWNKNTLPDFFKKMVINPKGELFLTVDGKGLFVSRDKAKSWELRFSGNLNITEIAFDKFGNLFYCNESEGVFISKDSAKSWDFTGCKKFINSISIHNNLLYAGGGGLFQYNYNYVSPAQKKIIYPLDLNNTWQYITSGGSTPVTGGGSSSLNLDTVYVTADTIINNYTYYKLNDYPNDWIRYSENDNKLYVYYNNQDVVQTDFNSIDGAPNSQLLLGSHTYWNSTVSRGYDTVVSLPGDWINLQGSGGGAISRLDRKYNSGLGYTYYSYSGYNTGSGGSSSTSRLISAHIYQDGKIKDYSNPYYPEIEITPPKVINDPFLQFSFRVKHKYNYLVSTGKSLIYVDSVYLTGFYKKNDTIVGNIKIRAENLEQTYIFMVDTLLNFDLLKRGYSFYFNVYAKDKGLTPKISVKPDTGYFCVTYSDLNPVETENANVYSFALKQNYPNPANPTSVISYSIPEASRVKLTLYNSLGQVIKILEDTDKTAGHYKVIFNGSGLSSGIYFYKLNAGNFSATKKLILMK